jgi:hypothetical protein
VDDAADVSVPSDAVMLKVYRFGWLFRAAAEFR